MNLSLQDSKNDLTSIVEKAITEGAQTVTSNGERTAVVLAAEEYDRLTSPRPSIVNHLLSGPKWDDDLANDVGHRVRTSGHSPEV